MAHGGIHRDILLHPCCLTELDNPVAISQPHAMVQVEFEGEFEDDLPLVRHYPTDLIEGGLGSDPVELQESWA